MPRDNHVNSHSLSWICHVNSMVALIVWWWSHPTDNQGNVGSNPAQGIKNVLQGFSVLVPFKTLKLKINIQLQKMYIYVLDFLDNFIDFFLKLFNEVASLILEFWRLLPHFGSSKTERSLPSGEATFDQVPAITAPCGSARDLWALLEPRERYLGAPSLKHLYIMTQSSNLSSSLWLMSSHPNDFSPSEIWSYFFKPRTIQ